MSGTVAGRGLATPQVIIVNVFGMALWVIGALAVLVAAEFLRILLMARFYMHRADLPKQYPFTERWPALARAVTATVLLLNEVSVYAGVVCLVVAWFVDWSWLWPLLLIVGGHAVDFCVHFGLRMRQNFLRGGPPASR